MREDEVSFPESVERRPSLPFVFGQEIGPRKEQEDAFCALELPNGDNLFVVADGHGVNGAKAANYCVSFVKEYLLKIINSDESFVRGSDDKPNYTVRWRELFLNINDEIMKRLPETGTTLTLLLLKDKDVLSVHVGDSQARIFRSEGNSKTLAVPHRPTEKNEKHRLDRLGAHIVRGRIVLGNAHFAVSRSLGYPEDGEISPIPVMQRYSLTSNDKFILLCSDGFSDVLLENKSRRIAVELIFRESESAEEAASRIKELLESFDLVDNTTYVVVDIRTV